MSKPTWTLPSGKTTTDYAEYSRLLKAEQDEIVAKNGGSSGGSSSNPLIDQYSGLFDKQLSNTKSLMGVTHDFRVKEGATQGQMDAQSFKRLNAELETRKYMQGRGQELTNWQRDQDQKRAMASFKNVGR